MLFGGRRDRVTVSRGHLAGGVTPNAPKRPHPYPLDGFPTVRNCDKNTLLLIYSVLYNLSVGAAMTTFYQE